MRCGHHSSRGEKRGMTHDTGQTDECNGEGLPPGEATFVKRVGITRYVPEQKHLGMVETFTKHQNIYLAKKNCPVFPPENTGSLETIEAWKKHVYQVSQGISAIY